MMQPDETPQGLPSEEPAPADPGDVDRIRDAIRPFAEVSTIAEWINRACCERLVVWDVDKDARARRLPFYGRTHTPLDIALMRSGRAREDECEAALVAAGGRCVTTATRDKMGELVKTPWDTFIVALATAQPGEIVYGREVLIDGPIGAFDVGGAIDFVILMWEGLLPILRLVECKASRRDRAYQRVQVGIYGLLVRAALAALPLIVAGVRLTQVQCVVARIEEATNTLGDLLTLPPLDLRVVEDDVARFLAPDGRLYRIYMSDEDALEFQLDPKCDMCTNNSGCLAEAARKRQVQLIGCSTTTTRILRLAGVTTIDALADLDLAGVTAQRIRRNPDFTEDLAVLQRRAQVRRTTLPGGKHALPVLPGGTTQPVHEVEPLSTRPLSQLPAHDVAAPEPLVRVFLEVSYDYVEDRVVAVAAHITRWTPAPEVREDRLIRVEMRTDTDHVVSEGELRAAAGAMYGPGADDLVAADRDFADAHAARRARRAIAEGPRVYLRHRTRAEQRTRRHACRGGAAGRFLR